MRYEKINRGFERVGTRVVLRLRFLLLALVLLLAALGAMGTARLAFDSSNESFFPEDDDLILQNERFQEMFGSEEFVFLLVEAPDVFAAETLEFIRSLCRDLRENLPFVDRVTSLTDIEYIEAGDDTLEVRDLVGERIPSDRGALRALRERALSKPIYVDRILSRDGARTGIFVSFQPIPESVFLPVPRGFTPLGQAGLPADRVILADRIRTEDRPGAGGDAALTSVADPRKLIAPALRAILERHRDPAVRLTAAGMPVLDFEIDRVTEREGKRFGGIALGVAVLLMASLFRSFYAVAAPFLVIAATLAILYGIMGWLGLPLTLVSIVVPTLILVISVGYSVHVIHHLNRAFRQTGSRTEAVGYAFRHAGWPCFLTAATTAAGFASFLLVPIQPVREVGILCAAGSLLTYVLVMVMVPVLFSFGRDHPSRAEGRPVAAGRMDGCMVRWADLATRRPALLGLAGAAVAAACVFFTLRVRVESDFLLVLGNRVPLVRDARRIVESLGGLYSYEVAVELPEDGMARDPQVLEALDALARAIGAWDSTAVTTSLADVVKDIHMSMNRNRPEFHGIPASRDLVAQYLLLYEMSGGEELAEWTDYAYRNLRLSVQVKSTSTAMEERFGDVRELGGRLLPPGSRVRVVGEVPLMVRMVNLLSRGQVRSVLAAFAVITAFMVLLLGSVRVGLLSMVPNTFPILLIGAVMGAAGIQLDMVTVMVMPMILGIAVDDTVHYIFHFQQEFLRTGRYREANRRTFVKVGPAMVFTSIILCAGFLIFALSDMRSMVSMALLSSAGILTALAADMLVTPALFVFLKPFGPERDRAVETVPAPEGGL